MKRSACSSALLIVAVAALAPSTAESRRSSFGKPSFLSRKSQPRHQSTADDCLYQTENALYSPTTTARTPTSQQPLPRQTTTAQHCDNDNRHHQACDDGDDRAARYAVQRGRDEIQASRVVEDAYLLEDDDEFPMITPAASNMRIVPATSSSGRPPLEESDLYHV